MPDPVVWTLTVIGFVIVVGGFVIWAVRRVRNVESKDEAELSLFEKATLKGPPGLLWSLFGAMLIMGAWFVDELVDEYLDDACDGTSYVVEGVPANDPDGGLIVRSAPDRSSSQLTVLLNGAMVEGTGEQQGEWIQVCVETDVGWSHGAYLRGVP